MQGVERHAEFDQVLLQGVKHHTEFGEHGTLHAKDALPLQHLEWLKRLPAPDAKVELDVDSTEALTKVFQDPHAFNDLLAHKQT